MPGESRRAAEVALSRSDTKDARDACNRTVAGLRAAKVYCGRLALLTALDIVLYALSFTQVCEIGSLHRRNMDEDILRSILWLDEAETFDGIEPLYGAD